MATRGGGTGGPGTSAIDGAAVPARGVRSNPVTVSDDPQEYDDTQTVERRSFPINWLLVVAGAGFILGVILLFIGPSTSVALTNTYTSDASARTVRLACNSPVNDWIGTTEPRPLQPPLAPVSSVSWKIYEQDSADVASACSTATTGGGHLAIAVMILSAGVGAVVLSVQRSRREPEPGDGR